MMQGGGRGVVATQNIRTGDIIFKSAPYAHIVHKESLDKFCSYCHEPLSDPSKTLSRFGGKSNRYSPAMRLTPPPPAQSHV